MVHQVKTQICADLEKQTPNYLNYFPPLNKLDWNLCPALIFAVSSLGQSNTNRIKRLAEIVQTILLACYIHHPCVDGEKASRNYGILLGDYLLGSAFLRLSAQDLFSYMKEFTKLIQTINEGAILRWRLQNRLTSISSEDWVRILSKEKASITALSGKLAAQMAGLPLNQQEVSEELGYNLGMAWAIQKEALNLNLTRKYLENAEHLIESSTPYGTSYSTPYLFELYSSFLRELI